MTDKYIVHQHTVSNYQCTTCLKFVDKEIAEHESDCPHCFGITEMNKPKQKKLVWVYTVSGKECKAWRKWYGSKSRHQEMREDFENWELVES